MKTLKEISDEFIYQMNVRRSDIFISTDKVWKIYLAISGFNKGEYYYITFQHLINFNPEIEISHTTNCTKEIFKIIKEIEPKAKVTYYKKVFEEVTE